jgi:hypothetical protein
VRRAVSQAAALPTADKARHTTPRHARPAFPSPPLQPCPRSAWRSCVRVCVCAHIMLACS